jgi:hypothetical protein
MKPQICSIHLIFGRGCFEAVLIENTSRTLGVKIHFCILLYIKIPSKYIAIPSLHTFMYVKIPLLYSSMLSYALKLSCNFSNYAPNTNSTNYEQNAYFWIFFKTMRVLLVLAIR